MKILTLDGFSAPNIGNAFYMNGARYLIKICLPQAELFSLGDVSGNQWTSKICQKNDFTYIQYTDIDYVVITGPCLAKNIERLYREIFDRLLKKKKTKLILLSVSGYTYNKDEVMRCRSFLKKYPPFMLFTRDESAYNHYHDLAEISYNGICTAWFVSDYFREIPVTMPPYITMVFDSLTEPKVKILGNIHDHIQDSHVQIQFPINIHDNNFISKVVNRAQFHLLPFFSIYSPSNIGEYQVIRPTHRSSYRYSYELFAKKNVYVSEAPDGYLNLYKNTSLNLTDRVHSAVVSLAFGRPTRIFTKSKRANLFDRVGAHKVKEEITYINQNRLIEEKEKLKEKFKSAF